MIYNIKANNNSQLIRFYNQAIKELCSFYNLNWIYNKPNIFILGTKEDVETCRKDTGLSKFKGASGWVGNAGVYVVSKDIYNKMIQPTDLNKEYLMLIKHELSHLFFQQVSQFCSKPDWLWEGCAVYLSGQNKYKKVPNKFQEFLKFFDQKSGGDVYRESGFVVQLLVEKFGKNKLIGLIKTLKEVNTAEEFQKLFQKVYPIDLSYEAINKLWSSSN